MRAGLILLVILISWMPVRVAHTTALYQVPVGLNLGNMAPELEFLNPAGKTIKLSSLRGKMVLIDFWASWCGPCRHENPNVVLIYNTYRNKRFKNGNGFTIYGVSLDTDAGRWKNAISQDGLVWENHVSDLKGWYSDAAAKYGVQSIPTNVLINGDGIIVDKNLTGEHLEKAMEKNLAK